MGITDPTTHHPQTSPPPSWWTPARVRRLDDDRAVVAAVADGASAAQVCAAGLSSSPTAVRAAIARTLALVRWDGDVAAARTVEFERHEALWPPLLGELRVAVASGRDWVSNRLAGAAINLSDLQMRLVGWWTRPLAGPPQQPPIRLHAPGELGGWSEMLERRAAGERRAVIARHVGIDPADLDGLLTHDAAVFVAPAVARYRTRTLVRLDVDTRNCWSAAINRAGVDAAAVGRVVELSGQRIELLGLEQSIDPHAPCPAVHPSTALRKDLP